MNVLATQPWRIAETSLLYFVPACSCLAPPMIEYNTLSHSSRAVGSTPRPLRSQIHFQNLTINLYNIRTLYTHSSSKPDKFNVQPVELGLVACSSFLAWYRLVARRPATLSNPDCGKGPSSLYTVTYPAVTNHLQNMSLSPCARPNFPCSTDAGAPPLCSQDCPQ